MCKSFADLRRLLGSRTIPRMNSPGEAVQSELVRVPAPPPVWCLFFAKHSKKCLFLVGLIVLMGFNGLWRVGRDSSLYRGLGHSLAEGRGFVFANQTNRHAYPGLPWVLAVLERVFGEQDWPPLVFIMLCGLAFLFISYRLIARHYPCWVATLTVMGVGINGVFVQQAHEIMTDMPFALGVVLALYAWDHVRTRRRVLSRLAWTLPLLVGLLLAATMRPTFWVLAVSFLLAGLIALVMPDPDPTIVRHEAGPVVRHRKRAAVVIMALIVLTVAVVAILDPGSIMSGRYKLELLDQIERWQDGFFAGVWDVLNRELNAAFFAQTLSSPPYLFSILLLLGVATIARRHPLWALCVAILVIVTIILSAEMRYYLMVLPILWLGWIRLADLVTRRLRPGHRAAVMAFLILSPIVMNLGQVFWLIVEQRRADLAWFDGTQSRSDRFYSYYRNGEVPLWKRMGQAIHERSAPTDRILAPEANIVAYFARDREVVSLRSHIALRVPVEEHAQKLLEYRPTIVVFPARLYIGNDSNVNWMMQLGIISSKRMIRREKQGDQTLFTLDRPQIDIPVGDWRIRQPTTRATSGATSGPTTSSAELGLPPSPR